MAMKHGDTAMHHAVVRRCESEFLFSFSLTLEPKSVTLLLLTRGADIEALNNVIQLLNNFRIGFN